MNYVLPIVHYNGNNFVGITGTILTLIIATEYAWNFIFIINLLIVYILYTKTKLETYHGYIYDKCYTHIKLDGKVKSKDNF